MSMPVEERRAMKWSLIFCAPWIFGFTVFVLFPSLLSLYFSFCDYSVLTRPVFAGLTNYEYMLKDDIFWISLRNTLVFAGISLPLGVIVSLGLALLLDSVTRGRSFFRVVFFVPSLVPFVAMALLWQYLLNPEYGLVNVLLRPLGIQGPDWLGDPMWSKPAMVLTGLWGVGNSVVIYLASLQDVPRSLYEAAEIDGANWLQRIIHITLPMISPVIYFNLIISVIFILQIFVLPYVMFGPNGEPARSTLFYAMYLFNQAFSYLRMGYASALAWVLFLMTAILTWLAHKATARHVHSEN